MTDLAVALKIARYRRAGSPPAEQASWSVIEWRRWAARVYASAALVRIVTIDPRRHRGLVAAALALRAHEMGLEWEIVAEWVERAARLGIVAEDGEEAAERLLALHDEERHARLLGSIRKESR